METGTVQVRSRERIHIRTRESGVTLSAWRVSLDAPPGAVVLVEINGQPVYRGEGELLGAGQASLAEVWRAALPPDEPPENNPQLG
jgi:hypothetical protein